MPPPAPEKSSTATRRASDTRERTPFPWASARPQAEARLGGRSLDSSEGGRRLAVWRRGSRMRRPPRGDPRPSWYVRVRGGSTRGEPLTSTGSTGAAPPYTCGGPLGCVKPPLPSGQSADHRFGFGRQRLCWATHSSADARRPPSTLQREAGVGNGGVSMPNALALNGSTRAGSDALATDASH